MVLRVMFQDALVLNHNASHLILPANIMGAHLNVEKKPIYGILCTSHVKCDYDSHIHCFTLAV